MIVQIIGWTALVISGIVFLVQFAPPRSDVKSNQMLMIISALFLIAAAICFK